MNIQCTGNAVKILRLCSPDNWRVHAFRPEPCKRNLRHLAPMLFFHLTAPFYNLHILMPHIAIFPFCNPVRGENPTAMPPLPDGLPQTGCTASGILRPKACRITSPLFSSSRVQPCIVPARPKLMQPTQSLEIVISVLPNFAYSTFHSLCSFILPLWNQFHRGFRTLAKLLQILGS